MNSLLVTGAVALAAAITPVPGDTIDTSKPLKVFVLAGQSNMQGHGRIEMGKDGDLPYTARQDRFSYLKDGDHWAERDDVWFYHKPGKGGLITSKLKPGLGANAGSVGHSRSRHPRKDQ